MKDAKLTRIFFLRNLAPKRDVFLSEEEIGRFLAANRQDHFYPLYIVALNTGMRRGELAGLQWDAVRFETGQIEVRRTLNVFGLRETTKTARSSSIVKAASQLTYTAFRSA